MFLMALHLNTKKPETMIMIVIIINDVGKVYITCGEGVHDMFVRLEGKNLIFE